jgi:hypothetical protein
LAELTSLSFQEVSAPIGLGVVTVALLIWGVGHFDRNKILKSFIYITSERVDGFGVLEIQSDRIVIRRRHGQVMLQCPDDSDEGKAFVLSANNMILQRP